LLLLPRPNYCVTNGRLETEESTCGQTSKTEENVCILKLTVKHIHQNLHINTVFVYLLTFRRQVL